MTTPTQAGPRTRYNLVLAIFFASGFSALVYQVVWVEMLDKVFGVTTFAASAVLGAYFGGLALGGFLGGKLPEHGNGLRQYGFIEIALAATALCVPNALALVADAYIVMQPFVAERQGVSTAARFFLSFSALAVPATLVGMTLPVLVRTLAKRQEELGRYLPRLYGWNTFGSVLGALLTGYVLIGLAGLRLTMYLAVGINLTAGVAALLASRDTRERSTDDGISRPPPDAQPSALHSGWRKAALAVTFCSGFAALGYEVAWFRALGLMSDHRAPTFSAIVAIVLVGIGAGSLALEKLRGRVSVPSQALTTVFLGLGAFGFLWLPLVASASSAVAAVSRLSAPDPVRSGVPFAAAIAITLAPSMLMGMSFPLAVQIYAERSRAVGESVGRMYAANLIGAMLASIFTGFVLLPIAGVQMTLYALSFVCLVAAALLHRDDGPAQLRRIGYVAVLAATLAALGPRDLFESVFLRVYPQARVIDTREDVEATVTLARDDSRLIMYVNGAHQADDSPWTLSVHRLIGLVPCLVHGDVQRALVIGMGGGTTAGAIARCARDTTIVEISPGVVEAARAFGSLRPHPGDARVVNTIIADGRNYLLVTPRRFDLMAADTIRPVHAQSANLYSYDYYRLVSARLAPRGIAFQWVDVSLREHEELILMRSFVTAFAHVAMSEIGGNKFLLGSNDPLSIDAETLRARLTTVLRHELARAGVADPEVLLSSFSLADDELRAAIGSGAIITDDRPINEYFGLLRVGNLWRLLPSDPAAYRPGS